MNIGWTYNEYRWPLLCVIINKSQNESFRTKNIRKTVAVRVLLATA